MIRVAVAPEPVTFNDLVRKPGLNAIAELAGDATAPSRKGPKRKQTFGFREAIPSGSFPDYWTKALENLVESYGRICAFVACYIHEVTGMPTVDHMIPKSKRWDLVYEWSNYRLACHFINTKKRDLLGILDPFNIQDDWFSLEFVGYQVVASSQIPKVVESNALESTLALLNLPACCRLRRHYVDSFRKGNIDLERFRNHAPFVAKEFLRQRM